MAYVKVETSVRTNKKFLTAGPAPSWLWLCGLTYCQDGLTDGFIPDEAIDYLGVKNARRLAVHLVKANLWEPVAGGWQVHDYLEHNRSALHVNGIKDERRKSGRQGGMASGLTRRSTDATSVEANREANREANASPVAEANDRSKRGSSVEPICTVAVAVDASVAVLDLKEKDTPPFDRWWLDLTQRYPANRVTNGHTSQVAFLQAFERDGRQPVVVWADMLDGLENQKAGHEWRVKGMVPRLEKWLTDGLWRQRHEAAPVSERVSEKTSRTLTSAAEFIKAGKRGT